MGAFFAAFGTSLPALRGYLGVDVEVTALLSSILLGGYAVTSLIGGILSDLVRRDKILMTGCFFLGIGMLLLGRLNSIAFTFAVVLCMGISSGLILSSSNTIVVALYPERKGAILNIHHVFFGAGSLLGPLLLGFLLQHNYPWQNGFVALSFCLIVLFLIFIRTYLPLVRPTEEVGFPSRVKQLLCNRWFALLTLVCTTAVGTQFAIMFLSVSFLREGKGLSILLSSLILSLFFVSLIVGRMICGWLATRMSNSTIILLLLVFFAAVVIMAEQGPQWISGLGIVVSGLACSGIFPCLLALTGTLFSDLAGTALGILSTMGGIGGMFLCWLIGFTSRFYGIEAGFGVLIFSSLISLAIFLTVYKTFLREETLIAASLPGGRL